MRGALAHFSDEWAFIVEIGVKKDRRLFKFTVLCRFMEKLFDGFEHTNGHN